MENNIWDNENLIKTLKENSVVVMPTDTIYGIVGKALNKDVVERIYKIRERSPDKPCPILIGNIDELNKFSVILSEKQKETLQEYWASDPTQDFQLGPTSIVLDCPDNSFAYLHRGTKTLAFRIPASQVLRDLLLKVGPLIAPSANPEGLSPAKTIEEAKKYFGNSIDPVRGRGSLRALAASNGVDLYIDGGELKGKASKIIKLNNDDSIVVLRE